MKREILFRGKSIMSGYWVYGYLVYDDKFDRAYIYTNTKDGMYTGCIAQEVIPATVGQLTGAKDDSDMSIYEGDIVLPYSRIGRGKKKLSLGVVEYSSITTQWYPSDICNGLAQIIGNIHDNPELITIL